MNKKMLLVMLLPFVAQANFNEFRQDVQAQIEFINLITHKPFGDTKEYARLNRLAAAVTDELTQRGIKKIVRALDAKYLGKQLVDTKHVKLATGDLLCFAAAVTVSCAKDVNGNSPAHNVVSHTATRLAVVGLDKAYDVVAPKVASLVGLETIDPRATITENLPKETAELINFVGTTLTREAVYTVVRDSIARAVNGFFTKND